MRSWPRRPTAATPRSPRGPSATAPRPPRALRPKHRPPRRRRTTTTTRPTRATGRRLARSAPSPPATIEEARIGATRIGGIRTAGRKIAGASGIAAATPTVAAKIAIAPRTGLPPRTAASRTATGTRTEMASSIGADVVPPGRSVVVSAKSGVSKRRPIGRRRSRPPRAAPASSTSCPRAMGSCGPVATCPGPRTSMCRCRTCASTRCARATP